MAQGPDGGTVAHPARYTHAMFRALRGVAARVRSAFRFLALFVAIRVTVGVGIIVFWKRDTIAWGPELSAAVIGALVVVLLVGLAVRYIDAHPKTER